MLTTLAFVIVYLSFQWYVVEPIKEINAKLDKENGVKVVPKKDFLPESVSNFLAEAVIKLIWWGFIAAIAVIVITVALSIFFAALYFTGAVAAIF